MQPWEPSAQIVEGRALVRVAVVHESDDMPAQMPKHVVQEGHHLFLGDVVPEEHAKQAQALLCWTDGDARDDGDSIIGEVVADQRGAAHGCPGSSHRRRQHEA